MPRGQNKTEKKSSNGATLGKVVDDAMVALERDNPRIKGVLPKNYARPGLDKHRLGELIDLIGSIQLGDRLGDISIYGQESNSTTRNLAIMNLATLRDTLLPKLLLGEMRVK